MPARNLTLYSHALSPYALKVRCYLLYKQLPFHIRYVNPLKQRLELPLGRTVPVLCCDGDCRNESSQLGVWLDQLFPDSRPLLHGDTEKVLAADSWVNQRLIPGVFRLLLGHGDPLPVLVQKRWAASGALQKTVSGGVPVKFRVWHLLQIHKAPFIDRLIHSTDLQLSNRALRATLTEEFTKLLEQGPFLGASHTPTLADASAFPQIVVPFLRGDKDYLLQGERVTEWVDRMKAYLPDYRELLPAVLVHRKG